MKNFDLNYNLFENEINQLSKSLIECKMFDNAWLHNDEESIKK